MCGQENADYSFLVDASGSILPEEFVKLKQFIKGVVDYLSIGPALTHVGLIEYSRSAEVRINFTTSYDKEEIKKLVDEVPRTAGITRIDLALEVASNQLFTPKGGMRPNSRKVKYVRSQLLPTLHEYVSTVLIFCLEPITILSKFQSTFLFQLFNCLFDCLRVCSIPLFWLRRMWSSELPQ